MLTNNELKQIKDYLALYGKKDSQLEAVNVDLNYPEVTFGANDYLSVVQDSKNKIIKIKDLEKVFLLTFLTDEDFREALKGKIPEEMLENACVTTEKLADGAVTTIKLDANAVTAAKIATGAITGDKIANNTIQGSAFAANSITTDKIVDGTVTGDKLADGSIQSVDIKDNTLSGSKFVDGSISGSKIQDDVIESKHLVENSIPASKIKDGSIEGIDIKDGTLDGSKVKDNTIEGVKFANSAITTDKIVDNSITTSKIANDAVTEDKIVDDGITTAKIANSSVTTNKIVDEAITEDKLANGAVTTAKLADGLISEIQNITDATPTTGSVKPVQSGGVKTAIDNVAFSTNEKVKNVGIDAEPTAESVNLVTSGGITDMYGSYTESPEYVYVQTDNENKVLYGIRVNGEFYFGAGCPQQVKDYIEEKISSLSLDEYENIVSFLSDYLESDTTLKVMIDGINTQIATKLDAEGLDPDALSLQSTTTSPEYLQVTTDSEDKILEGIKHDGTKVFKTPLEIQEVRQETIDNSEFIQVTTDEEGKVIEGTRKNGQKYFPCGVEGISENIDNITHNIENLDERTSLLENESDPRLVNIIGMLSVGLDNIELSNNPKTMSVLNNLFTDKEVIINGTNDNTINLKPCITIIDDDTIDNQIPSSFGGDSPSRNDAGYFSLLLPITLSLAAKHNKAIPLGLACEGHRVGLTTYEEPNDNYSTLNENGRAVKWIHDNMGWDVLNHSMTAQLPLSAFCVDGINSELASTILTNGNYQEPLSFYNTCVIDRLTGKWYEVNETKTAWVERVPTKKYAIPFYRDYNNPNTIYFNRDFDFEYNWGEWFKRAKELGLPFERAIVHNGSTTSVWMISAARKYSYFTVRTSGHYNIPPIAASVNRTDANPSANEGNNNNVWSDAWVENKKEIIAKCLSENTWIVFMSHFSNRSYNSNYYKDGVNYPEPDPTKPELRGKDANYPSEWTVPLNYQEIQDIIGDNVHDYINHPPSRLGINSWGDWYPAPGTQNAAVYYILDYALSQGVDIVAPMEGWKIFGNILNIGVDRNGQTYTYDEAERQTPYTAEEKSYLTIGADMTIRYYNGK